MIFTTILGLFNFNVEQPLGALVFYQFDLYGDIEQSLFEPFMHQGVAAQSLGVLFCGEDYGLGMFVGKVLYLPDIPVGEHVMVTEFAVIVARLAGAHMVTKLAAAGDSGKEDGFVGVHIPIVALFEYGHRIEIPDGGKEDFLMLIDAVGVFQLLRFRVVEVGGIFGYDYRVGAL